MKSALDTLALSLPVFTGPESIRAALPLLHSWNKKADEWRGAYGFDRSPGSTYAALTQRDYAASPAPFSPRATSRNDVARMFGVAPHPLHLAWSAAADSLSQAIKKAAKDFHPRQYFNASRRSPIFTQASNYETREAFSSENVILAAWPEITGRGDWRKAQAMKEWLESRTGDEYQECEDGELVLQDDAYYCDLSECYYSSDSDFVTYYTRGNGCRSRFTENTGHESKVEDVCFKCGMSGEWFKSSDFTAVECEGDTVCLEWNEDSIYYWESDGEYHTDYEPEESEEDEDSRGRAPYHGSHRPSWWSNPAAKHGVSPDSFLVGMELECKCRDMDDFCDALAGTGLLTEEDGSLDSQSGVEVIGGPYTLAQYQAGETAWEAFYSRVECDGVTGHDAGAGYGIHLSVSRASFTSSLHLSKFVVFFNMAESLCCRIAQRANIYGGGYKIQRKVKASLSTDKYEPCKVDEKRAEVRIFRSNVRPERVLKNVEFVAAVYEFTKLASVADIQDEQAATASFLAWLARVENLKGFPALASFLGERDNAGTSYAPFVSRLAHKAKGEKYKAAPAPVAMDA